VGGVVHQLTALDAAMLWNETGTTKNVSTSVWICQPPDVDGFSPIQAMRKVLQQRLWSVPELTWKIHHVPAVLDFPYWQVDPAFDLDRHLHRIPTHEPMGNRQFEALVAGLHGRPMDMNGALWDMYVVDAVRLPDAPAGCFAVVLRNHHVLGDGVGITSILASLRDERPDGPVPNPGTVAGLPIPATIHPRRIRLRAALRLAQSPFGAIHLFSSLITGAGGLVRALSTRKAGPPAWRAPRTRFNRTVRTTDRRLTSISLPLAGMRAVKAGIPGVTLNDVYLSVVAGALRRYLASTGELPDRSLVTAIPVSVRPEGGRRHGNHLGFMNARLFTDIADPRERLLAIAGSTAEAKLVLQATGLHRLPELADMIPSVLTHGYRRIQARIAGIISPLTQAFNVSASNVALGQGPLFVAGAEIVQQWAYAPFPQWHGVIHVGSSYRQHFTICVTAAADILPDIAEYRRCLQHSWQELAETVPAAGFARADAVV
jgi:WS/DGAT/MGAT family acyltransferase